MGSLRTGTLGVASIAFFVISAAGPLVAMAGGIPVAMLFGNGPGIPAVFLAATLILITFSIGYTAMAARVRSAGAFFAFAAKGLGGRAAGATGLIALLSYNGIQIGLYGLFGAAAKALLEPTTGIFLPWWLYALVAMATIAWFGYRQVDLSAKLLGLLVAGEYLVVVVLDVAIIGSGGHSGLSAAPFAPEIVATGSPAIGLMLCFSAFVGFEATTIYSEEARDPERTIPLATYFSVLLIGIFYTVSTWAVVVGAGTEQLMPMLRSYPDPTLFLFDLAGRYVGGWLQISMGILFVTSAYAGLLAFHNGIARYLFAMGREGILPAALARTHPAMQSPHIGSITQSAVAFGAVALFALAGADPILTVFTLCSAVATLGILTLMAIASLATFRFFNRDPERRYVVLIAAGLSLAAFGTIAILAVVRFDLLAGGPSALSYALPLLIPAVAAIGVALATHGRRHASAGSAAC